MKTKRKSRKRRKHHHHGGLHGMAVPKEMNAKIKAAAWDTGKDFLIGVVGGGVAGLLLGKSSLLIGAGITGYGHFENKPFFKTFGMGMMMGGGATAAQQAMSGLSPDEIKSRIVSFKDSLLSKLYLDKVFKEEAKKGVAGAEEDIINMNGLGENDLDFSTLTKLEQQVLNSGHEYQKKKEIEAPATESGTKENLSASYAELLDTKNGNY
ncbi:MAG TPA: hypothetical protein VN698_16170 [Bacteroidia bacterium]|nr:hypothetical protein [Bacteroidia bacterium]